VKHPSKFFASTLEIVCLLIRDKRPSAGYLDNSDAFKGRSPSCDIEPFPVSLSVSSSAFSDVKDDRGCGPAELRSQSIHLLLRKGVSGFVNTINELKSLLVNGEFFKLKHGHKYKPLPVFESITFHYQLPTINCRRR